MSYGVWIERDMKLEEVVYGPIDGRLGVTDIITVGPFVTGIPNTTARPTGNATLSGDFVGFDVDATVMALLRADASLRYTLATERMAVGITDFDMDMRARAVAASMGIRSVQSVATRQEQWQRAGGKKRRKRPLTAFD